jgi:hypothetical protein
MSSGSRGGDEDGPLPDCDGDGLLSFPDCSGDGDGDGLPSGGVVSDEDSFPLDDGGDGSAVGVLTWSPCGIPPGPVSGGSGAGAGGGVGDGRERSLSDCGEFDDRSVSPDSDESL